MRAYMILAALLAALPAAIPAAAQSVPAAPPPRPTPTPVCERTIYGVGGVNQRCVVGLRATVNDFGARRVDGVDLSLFNGELWEADVEDSSSVVRGATLSLVGADGDRLTGLNVGLVYAHGSQALRGLNVAGLAAGSDHGDVQGISAASIFIVAKRLTGINVSGGALIADRIRGLNVAGLVVYGKRIEGVSASGWSVQGGAGGIAGVHAGLVGVGAEGPVRGIAGGGLLVMSERDVSGVAASWLAVRARELNGLAVSAHTRVRGTQRGLTVGLLNRTRQLRGVQLGLLNQAENNPRLLRWLPLANVHL
jgi:hypothetical protein